MAKRKRQPGYPEPGQWVWDYTQSMPKIHPPEPLPDGLISLDELFEHITYEGLGQCLLGIPANRIQGLGFRKLWKTAQSDLSAILWSLEASLSFQEKPAGKPQKKRVTRKPKTLDFGEDVTED